MATREASAAAHTHWITPGTYDANPAVNSSVEPLLTDRFKTGDKVVCTKTFVPRAWEDLDSATYEGEHFTVRAYLRGYDYVIFEEIGHAGVQNGGRFERL